MGTAASTSNPEVGVPINPRVDYTDELSKKKGKKLLIDAPVLVELEHGTIRYRDPEKKHIMKLEDKDKRIERPHEGPLKLQQKKGYFYHARLNDFSKGADKTKEDEFKFKYVCKGPPKAKQKKLFYVYGKGVNAMTVDKGIIRSSPKKPQGKGYVWQDNFKQPNHAYYDMSFVQQDEEGVASDDEDADETSVSADDTINETETKMTKLKLHQEDTVLKVQERLGLQVLKPADHIHISLLNRELKSHEVIGDLRKPEDGKWTIFTIQLAKV